jgi:hypothetical protein
MIYSQKAVTLLSGTGTVVALKTVFFPQLHFEKRSYTCASQNASLPPLCTQWGEGVARSQQPTAKQGQADTFIADNA